MVSVELLTLRNADGVPLDGVLWSPDGDEPAGAAILHLHAKGGNFYTGPGRFIPELTATAPIAHLALNMRCHDLGTTRADLPCGDLFSGTDTHGLGAEVDGGMWERISDGHLDVAAGVALLRERGHRQVFVAGHSSGGFYVADAAARRLGIAGRILLSPLTGNASALPVWFGDGLADAVASARALVADGRGDQLIAVPHWYYAISARSLVERADEPPGVFADALAADASPLLMLYGSLESRAGLWSGIVDALATEDRTLTVIDGAEHHYVGHEQQIADTVCGWVLARSAA
jgi:pimeloyl-ACP methyl ester carboxylesterase